MQVNALKTDGLVHQYEVKIPAADIQRQVENRLQRISATVKIPGFRPGKVPAHIVQQRYGMEVLGEVMEDTANTATMKAMSEKNLRPAIEPRVEFSSAPKSLPAEQDLVMKVEVEVVPEIPSMDFTKISLEKPVVDVSEKDIEESLSRIAKANRKQEPMPDDYAAKNGDVVVMDFDGSVDGERRDGMKSENFPLELGSQRFIPGFEEQLVGLKKGDKKQVKVTFPVEYHASELASKEAVFEVTVHGVSQLKEHDMDDELAKAAGLENLEALKNAVREQIAQNYNNVIRAVLKRRLMDKLADMQKFPVPPTLSAREFEGLWQQIVEARAADQLDPSDKGKSEEALKKEYQGIAERRVRLGLLLSDVARKTKIEVGREDMRQAMFREAQRYPGQEKQVIEFFAKNAQAREQLTAPLLEEKVVDFILSKAEVKEKKISREELRKAAEA